MFGPPVDRRALQRGAAASLLPWPTRGEAAPVARRVSFENPEYRNVRLSLDGKHLSYLAPLDGVRNLRVAPIDFARSTIASPVGRALLPGLPA